MSLSCVRLGLRPMRKSHRAGAWGFFFLWAVVWVCFSFGLSGPASGYEEGEEAERVGLGTTAAARVKKRKLEWLKSWEVEESSRSVPWIQWKGKENRLRWRGNRSPEVASGHEVPRVRFSPAGDRALTVQGRRAQLWNLRTRRPGAALDARGFFDRAEFSADGQSILFLGRGVTGASLFDREGRASGSFSEGAQGTSRAAFAPRGSWVALGDVFGNLRLWNPMDQVFEGPWPVGSSPVEAIAWSSDASRLSVGLSDGEVVVWDVGSRSTVHRLARHEGPLSGLAFGPRGRRLVTYENAGLRVELWNPTTGEHLADVAGSGAEFEVSARSSSSVCLAFDSSGDRLAVGLTQELAAGETESSIQIWDSTRAELVKSFSIDGGVISRIDFFDHGARIVASVGSSSSRASSNGWIEISEDRSENGETWELRNRVGSDYRGVVPVLDRGRLGLIDSLGRLPESFVAGNGASVWRLPSKDSPRTVRFDPGTRLVGSSSRVDDLRLWNRDTQTNVPWMSGRVYKPVAASFSPSSSHLAVFYGGGGWAVWDFAQARVCAVSLDESEFSKQIRLGFGPEGKRFAFQGAGGRVQLFDLENGKNLTESGGEGQGESSSEEIGFAMHRPFDSDPGALPGKSVSSGDSGTGFLANWEDGDGAVHLMDVARSREAATLLFFEEGHWIFLLPSLHFFGTTFAAEWVEVNAEGRFVPLSCYSRHLMSMFDIFGWLRGEEVRPFEVIAPPTLSSRLAPVEGSPRDSQGPSGGSGGGEGVFLSAGSGSVELEVTGRGKIPLQTILVGVDGVETVHVSPPAPTARISQRLKLAESGKERVEVSLQVVNQMDIASPVETLAVEWKPESGEQGRPTNGDLASNENSSRPLRCLSFNVRYATKSDGENQWEARKALVFDAIRRFDPEVLGVQEALAFQLDDLLSTFPSLQSVGRGRRGGREDEFVPVLFDSSRFDLVDHGDFWLSPTPDEVGSKGWDADLPRICTWAILRETEAPTVEFAVFNVHFDHRGERAREESAKLVVEKSREIAEGRPILVLGDFNVGEGSKAMHELRASGLSDTFRRARPFAPDAGTFHGFSGTSGREKIDGVLASEAWEVIEAAIDRFNLEGRFPSDHFPVQAVLRRD